jgi:hypothetical protein
MLFKGQYWFRGTHADKVKKLIAEFDGKHKLFAYAHEVYQLAPIVGFLYNRKADLNRENNSDTSIFAEQISSYRNVFEFNYQLIMLLDKEHEINDDERVNKAFRYYGTDKAAPDEALYEAYVRGGVDILYEKLIEPSAKTSKPEEFINNLYEFMEEFESRYGQNVDEIHDLCRIARS